MEGESNIIQGNSVPRSLNELLDVMGNNDPRIRMLAEFMQKNASNVAEDSEKEARRKQFKRKILRLEKEHEILTERNDLLALALGACPYCWGRDVTCECRGHGVPGSRPPDEGAFKEFVLPVVKRYGMVMTQARKIQDNKNLDND